MRLIYENKALQLAIWQSEKKPLPSPPPGLDTAEKQLAYLLGPADCKPNATRPEDLQFVDAAYLYELASQFTLNR